MSTEALYKLNEEVIRLLIAGSRNAVGDPRLTRHLTLFRRLGENSAAFGKLASVLEGLVSGSEKESAANLCRLSSMLYAMLYTLGKSGSEGPAAELSERGVLPQGGEHLSYNEVSAWRQRPIGVHMDHMTSLLIDQPTLKKLKNPDPRLFQAVRDWMKSSYSTVLFSLVEYVLPDDGGGGHAAFAEYLMGDFEMDKSYADLYRFIYYARSLREKAVPLALEVLDSKADRLKPAAIAALGYDPAQKERLAECLKERKEDLLAAALRGLCRCSPPLFHDRFEYYLIKKPALLADAVIQAADPELAERYCGRAAELLGPFAESGKLFSKAKEIKSLKDLVPLFKTAFALSGYYSESIHAFFKTLFQKVHFTSLIKKSLYERDSSVLNLLKMTVDNLFNADERYRETVDAFCSSFSRQFAETARSQAVHRILKLPLGNPSFQSAALYQFYSCFTAWEMEAYSCEYDFSVKNRRVWGFLGEIPYASSALPLIPPLCLLGKAS